MDETRKMCNTLTRTPSSVSGHPLEDTLQGPHQHRQGTQHESVCTGYFISSIVQRCNKNNSVKSPAFPAFKDEQQYSHSIEVGNGKS